MKNIVYYDPANNINYSSFYIKGLLDVFGRKNVLPSSTPFAELCYGTETHVFAFTINGKRYAVDFADSNSVYYNTFLEWADVYGKINYNRTFIPETYQKKIVPCCPNFAIPILGNNKLISSLHALKNFFRCKDRLDYGFPSFLNKYLALSNRQTIINNKPASTDTIAFFSRLWSGQDELNRIRANFIRACKKLHDKGIIHFTGGLIPDGHIADSLYQDIVCDSEIPHEQYLELLNQSCIAFNTPAYYKCHGWKLPEFLSQGKVILSTPFENDLPVPLIHGENIFFVKDGEVETLYDAIQKIVSDLHLQKRLSTGAKKYWEEYGAPDAAIRLLTTANK